MIIYQLLIILSASSLIAADTFRPECDIYFSNKSLPKGDSCDRHQTDYDEYAMTNLMMIGGGHCKNDRSGICKLFAGRFEFLLNTFKDEAIGPAPKSQHVDDFGFHKRIPVAYNIEGNMFYADRSIQWSRKFVENLKRNVSLLTFIDFNWCSFTGQSFWPYKSAIKTPDGRYHIYFFNRQSCIYDTKTRNTRHFNTRFLHNSSLRIDLDNNPTIFSMQDDKTPNMEIRLVKHRRQHWHEIRYRVKENPKPGMGLFMEMDMDEVLPQKISRSTGYLLTPKTFKKFSNVCLSDWLRINGKGKNSALFQCYCGTDGTELADYPIPYVKENTNKSHMLEVGLHGIPRWPAVTETFFDVNVRDDDDWERFASDGKSFSAVTTIPIEGSKDTVRVLLLYISFRAKVEDKYDEYYPQARWAEYKTTYDSQNKKWNSKDFKFTAEKNLNHVDDIAYLHKCKSILVILGPLYQEIPVNEFSIGYKGTTGSIYDLNIWELATAFFAVPDKNTLFVYHRMNYVAEYEYTCGKPLVKARRIRYYNRHGDNSNPDFFIYTGKTNFPFSEETYFKKVGIFKGTVRIEPPDPNLYQLGDDPALEPLAEKSNWWLWAIVLAGVILALAMCMICLITFRRRRIRRHKQMMSSMLPTSTNRSGMSAAGVTQMPTRRSNMSGSPSSLKRSTARSSMSPAGRSGRSSSVSKRSTLTKAGRSRSGSASGRTVRSSVNQSSPSRSKSTTPRSRASTVRSSSPSSSSATRSRSRK